MTGSSLSSNGTPVLEVGAGTELLFSHANVRLLKTIPPFYGTERINGHVPQDCLGQGMLDAATQETMGAVLEDWSGDLHVYAAPEAAAASEHGTDDLKSFSKAAGTLFLTVEQPHYALAEAYGAERRHILPFRSYAAGNALPSDAVPRPTHLGFGAGVHGADGGSFWFFEDVYEEGGADRYRRALDGAGTRAVWAVWLFGASPATIDHLRNLLATFPASDPASPQTPNPHFWQTRTDVTEPPRQPQGVPSPLAAHGAHDIPQQTKSPRSPRPLPTPPPPPKGRMAVSSTSPRMAAARAEAGSPPPLALKDPILPIKPPMLQSLSSDAVTPTLKHLGPGTPGIQALSRVDRADARGNVVDALNAGIGNVPTLGMVQLPGSQPQATSDQTAQPAAEFVPEASAQRRPLPQSTVPPPAYRNSLVAVDTESGAIVGLVAQDVRLSHVDATASQGGIGEASAQPSVIRPASRYIDEDAVRPSSRRGSVLAEDTFAPPPVPEKASSMDSDGKVPASSAVPSDEKADKARKSISLDDSHRKAGIEAHRPDLLRDVPADVAEPSVQHGNDGSGSTDAGPAVKLFRKAFGGKAAKEVAEPASLDQKLLPQSEVPSSSTISAAAVTSPSQPEAPSESRVAAGAGKEGEASYSTEKASNTPSGSRSRDEMKASEVIHAENQVWKEAFESGVLPIDAAYTHLNASPDAESTDATVVRGKLFGDSQELPIQPAPASNPGVKEKDGAPAPTKESALSEEARIKGGTVLIEFLQGSHIQASLMSRHSAAGTSSRPTESPESSNAGLMADKGSAVTTPPTNAVLGVLNLIPAVPMHFLTYFQQLSSKMSLSSSSQGNESTPAAAAAGTGVFGNLASGLSEALSGISTAATQAPASFFTWLLGNQEVQKAPEAEDEEDSEWELAIPDFDPKSLASTPRPVYRRKRPAPSLQAGLAVRERTPEPTSQTVATPPAEESDAAPPAQPRKAPDQAAPDAGVPRGDAAAGNRYSIIHFDEDGVGRRAFLREDDGAQLGLRPGMAAMDGLRAGHFHPAGVGYGPGMF